MTWRAILRPRARPALALILLLAPYGLFFVANGSGGFFLFPAAYFGIYWALISWTSTPRAAGIAFATYHTAVMGGILYWTIAGGSHYHFQRAIWMMILDGPLLPAYVPLILISPGDAAFAFPVVLGPIFAYLLGSNCKKWLLRANANE